MVSSDFGLQFETGTLAPGQSRTVSLTTTGNEPNVATAKVQVQVKGKAFTFKVERRLLSNSVAQAKVHEIYDRYLEYTRPGSPQTSVQISAIETLIDGPSSPVYYTDLYDDPEHGTIAAQAIVSEVQGVHRVRYVPTWNLLSSELQSHLILQRDLARQLRLGDLQDRAADEGVDLGTVLAATVYHVDLTFGAHQLSYKASLLWVRREASSSMDFYVQDPVLDGLQPIAYETRPALSQISSLQPAAASVAAPDKDLPGALRCHERQTVKGPFSTSRTGLENHVRHDGTIVGQHSSDFEVRFTCIDDRDCTQHCEVTPILQRCREQGRVVNSGDPPLVTHRMVSELNVSPNTWTRDCGAGLGCAAKICFLGACPDNIGFGFNFADGGISIAATFNSTHNVSPAPIGRDCAPPVQCNPDPQTATPNTLCNWVDSSGVGSGGVTAELTITDLSHPPQDLEPVDLAIELALPSHVRVSPDISIPSNRRSFSTSYEFPDSLIEGTPFQLSVLGTNRSWSCPSVSDEFSGHGMRVPLSCTQFVVPPNLCDEYPDLCNPAPTGNCGTIQVVVIRTVRRITTITIDYPYGTYIDHTDTVVSRTRTVHGVEICPSHSSLAGAKGNPIQTEGPIVYTRHIPSVPVYGWVQIHGVARDDRYNVADVQVMLDGNPVSLADFTFNQPDSDTCGEIPNGSSCNANSRFSGWLDTSNLSLGSHTLAVVAENSAGVLSVNTSELLVREVPDGAGGGDGSTPLSLSTQPQDRHVTEGAATQFVVGASGGKPPYRYRWQGYVPGGSWFDLGGEPCCSGAYTPVLVVDPVYAGYDQTRVRCQVSDDDGNSVWSRTATLHVDAPLRVTGQPQDQHVSQGGTATFSVTAAGGTPGYQYQWQAINYAIASVWVDVANDADTSGARSPNLVQSPVDFGNPWTRGAHYRCRITDQDGTVVYSSTAALFEQ